MANIAKRVAKIPFAPVVALLFATAVAILVAACPQWRLEQAVIATGLDQFLPMAKPPLGMKARALAVIAAFLIVGLGLWLIVGIIERMVSPRPNYVFDDGHAPELPVAQKLEPAPSRRPIFADRELGAPLMSDAALTPVGPVAELIEPEVTMMPDAAPATLASLVEAPDLEAPIAIEEFDLPQMGGEPVVMEGESSIDALIRRLEAGLARRSIAPLDGPEGPGSALADLPVPLTLSTDWAMSPSNGEVPSNDDDEEATRSAMATLQRLAKR